MRNEAVKAGFYTSPQGVNFPKLQILTIEGLLGKVEQPKYPDVTRGGHTFKRSPLEYGRSTQGDLFSSGKAENSPQDNVEPITRSLRIGLTNGRKPPIRVTKLARPNTVRQQRLKKTP
jgi:hypothetical protein